MGFTEEQKKEIQGLLVESLKGDALKEVFGGLIDPLKAELTRQISGVSAKLSKSLKETEDKVTGLTSEEGRAALIKELASMGGNQQDPNKGGDKGDKGENKQPDPEVLKLRDALDKLNKERAAEREAAKVKEEAAQRALDQAAIDKALGAHVDPNPDVVTAARLLLTEGRKLITRDEEGKLVFTMQRKSGKETYPEVMSLDDGIAEWAKTDSAKHFLPPKDAGGSGDPAKAKGKAPAVGSNEANRSAFFADLNGQG